VREARWAIRPTRSSRLGGASAISFKRYSPWGRANAGGGRRGAGRAQDLSSAARFSHGVDAKPAALKERLAPNPRARGALGDQTDPLEPAGRRFGNFV
jgi:hypothetical protein